jgi:hypothetical protein
MVAEIAVTIPFIPSAKLEGAPLPLVDAMED